MQPNPETATSPTPTPPASNTRQLVRHVTPFRALLIVMIAFTSLFLLVRVALVEPFGVPTGSMSPSLIGHHRDGACPRCGATVRVGRPSRGNVAEHFSNVSCQNCDMRLSLRNARDLNGDRLLVDKNVYDLRSPRRWEMVVFRCPNPDPAEFGKPYVKRLIGLPGERIVIRNGDIYVNDEILRKGLAEVRETAVPVFDMCFAPNPGGWSMRWVVDGADPRLPATDAPAMFGVPTIEGNSLVLDAADAPQSTTAVRYRHWHLDERKETAIRAWNMYNGKPDSSDNLPTAHDFYLTCEVEVTAVAKPGEATFDCRLFDGADTVSAELTVGPRRSGRVQLMHEHRGELGLASGVSLEPGRRYYLEFAFVDRRVSFALDGREVIPAGNLAQPFKRADVSRPLRLGVRGCRVVVRNLKLHRDIHYLTKGEHGSRIPAILGSREYYVLGDNTESSADSREWPTPGVPEASFIGKPFLIHQPLRLGRFRFGGRDREFQTLDWSRLRWLH